VDKPLRRGKPVDDRLDFFPVQFIWSYGIADDGRKIIDRDIGQGIADDHADEYAGYRRGPGEKSEEENDDRVQRHRRGQTDKNSDGGAQGQRPRVPLEADEAEIVVFPDPVKFHAKVDYPREDLE